MIGCQLILFFSYLWITHSGHLYSLVQGHLPGKEEDAFVHSGNDDLNKLVPILSYIQNHNNDN